VLAYDQAGADQGNAHKTTKELASYDSDARAVLDALKQFDFCTGRLGAMGICIGGHLAFRAAMNPDVLAAACFYATDIHKGGLGKGMKDDSLGAQAKFRANFCTCGAGKTRTFPSKDAPCYGRAWRKWARDTPGMR